MDFAGITEVKIPQGNVEKITETSSGRVLWEGFPTNVKAHWELLELENDEANNNYYEMVKDVVDTGDGVEFFCNGFASSLTDKARPSRRFHYKANGTYGDVYTLWRGTQLQADDIAEMDYFKLSSSEQDNTAEPITGPNWAHAGWSLTIGCADIDPESKIWCVTSPSSAYTSNALSPIKWGPKLKSIAGDLCCWSPKLKRFCLVGERNSTLVDINGSITDEKYSYPSDSSVKSMALNVFSSNMLWSDKLGKFIINRGAKNDINYTRVVMSSNGLDWANVSSTFTGGKPDKLNTGSGEGDGFLNGLCYMDGKFLVDNAYDKHYIYASTDCQNWTCITELPNTGNTGASSITSLVYSPQKRVLLLSDLKTSYVTRDLKTWIEVPYATGTNTTVITRRWVRWSNSLNAFIRMYASAGGGLKMVSKLVIEN